MKIFTLLFLFSLNSFSQVNITVIDQGIDKAHPLFKNIKSIKNVITGEDSENAEDEIDGHGTHVAGIIVNNTSPKEVNLSVVKNQSEKFLLKVRRLPMFDKSLSNEEWSGHIPKAIDEAIKNKTNIINFSQITMYSTEEIKKAIELAKKNNILIVAASGNKDFDLSLIKKGYLKKITKGDYEAGAFPCSFQMDNVICVGNYEKDNKGRRKPYSNFGKDIIDVWANGMDIISACVGGENDCVMSGTSMSAPRVSAKIAQLWFQESVKRKVSVSQINYNEIKEIFLNSLNQDSNLLEFSKNGKYLD